MKSVRYGLIAFFCLGAVWGVTHMATLPASNGAGIPGFAAAPSARHHGQGNWRYLPVLR
ncbi:hypothetical protein [Sphingobium sp. Leaf26]|uniref:hypothetical protein n=1 Tax=Sphingobium sp. Leaf26 TaxID=1735693 RepID=UPI000A8CA2EC|nr:hypothetical protein [Sphingobium sp. Leaf26]